MTNYFETGFRVPNKVETVLLLTKVWLLNKAKQVHGQQRGVVFDICNLIGASFVNCKDFKQTFSWKGLTVKLLSIKCQLSHSI